MMRYLLSFILLLSTGIVFSQEKEITPEEIAFYKQHAQSPRDQENVEFTAEALLLTSTATPTFSEVGAIVNLGFYNATVPVLNQKTGSIDPEYNLGCLFKLLYRIPPTRNSIYFGYTYIKNNGKGSLNNDDTFVIQNGVSQRNIQHDSGSQHIHVNIFDLIVMRKFPMYEHITFALGGGLAFNDFKYYFTMRNDDRLISTGSSGVGFSDFDFDVKAQRKTGAWGLGPKIEWHFGFHFTKITWNHDVSLSMAVQLSTLFSKVWSQGNYSVVADSTLAGVPQPRVVDVGRWTDKSKFQVVPNINFDLSLRYKYDNQKYSIALAAGYKAYLYWELRETSRLITYRLNNTSAISDIASSDNDTLLFSGPYLRATVGF